MARERIVEAAQQGRDREPEPTAGPALRPQQLAEYIGQPDLKERLSIAIDAARARLEHNREMAERRLAVLEKSADDHETRIRAADAEPQNWMSHGRSYDEQRFSPLGSINRGNVAGLGLDWHFDFPTDRGLEATPLVVDGRMYVTGAWSHVYA